MKLVKLIFLFALLSAPASVAAQVQITQGYLHVENPIFSGQTITQFGFIQNVYASLGFNRVGEPLGFYQNRSVTGFTYAVEPTPEARGNYYTCVNGLLAHPSQPLSTRFQLSLGTFRVPRFPKREGPQTTYVEITVPFTMTGRLSCLVNETAQVINTTEVTGSGNVKLRFQRIDSDVRRIYLMKALYSFTNPAPSNVVNSN